MVVDMEPLVKTTYDLEGDRLEILVVSDRIERLRTMGRSLDDQATLPNTAAVLRARRRLDPRRAAGDDAVGRRQPAGQARLIQRVPPQPPGGDHQELAQGARRAGGLGAVIQRPRRVDPLDRVAATGVRVADRRRSSRCPDA